MSTTLEAELLQAADALEWAGHKIYEAGDDAGGLAARASRLRQRAAWVREQDPGPSGDGNPYSLYRRLAGPIPAAETAATERKEP